MLRINPAFFRHPDEAAIIGRLVVAFGELEYLMSVLSAWTTDQGNNLLRVLYRINATSSRISAGDSLLRPYCLSLGLIEEYEAMYSALWWCLSTRNRYAHCNWADNNTPPESGLFYADLQSAADEESGFDPDCRHVDAPLLQQQEEFFEYTQDWLQYLDGELAVRTGKKTIQPFPKPTVREPPPAHNPPSQHVPQWLGEVRIARHIERAAIEESGVPTPTRKQVALDGRREEKRARREADRARDIAKRSGDPPSDPPKEDQ